MRRIAIVGLGLITAGNTRAFEDFKTESARVSAEIACPKPKVNQGAGLDALYMCIGGHSETVKVFINADDGEVGVHNLKFMWNDWTKDIGYGVHADAAIAKAWLAALATRYAPHQVAEVVDVFFSDRGATIRNDMYVLTYTYRVGPSIDERMIVITKAPRIASDGH